jgi:hypothetical protein
MSLAVGLVYARIVESPFIFDDLDSIERNPSIVKLWPLVGDAAHPGPLNPPPNHVTSGRPGESFAGIQLSLRARQSNRISPVQHGRSRAMRHAVVPDRLAHSSTAALRAIFDWITAAALATAAALVVGGPSAEHGNRDVRVARAPNC